MRVTRRGSQELFAIPPVVSSHGFVGTRVICLAGMQAGLGGSTRSSHPGRKRKKASWLGLGLCFKIKAHIAYYHRQYYHRQPTATATTTSTYYRYHYDHYDHTIMSLRHELVLRRWKAPSWHRSRPSCWHSMGSEISS